jgi:predicted nucleic acid-binding protein
VRLFQNFRFGNSFLKFNGKTGLLTGFSKSLSKTNRVLEQAQVVNEFCVNAIRKGGDPLEIRTTAAHFDKYFHITPVTMNTIIGSFRIYELYQFSHWDCLIVAAALESGCEILYTEDLSDGQIINETLKIINPFIHNDIVSIVISEK